MLISSLTGKTWAVVAFVATVIGMVVRRVAGSHPSPAARQAALFGPRGGGGRTATLAKGRSNVEPAVDVAHVPNGGVAGAVVTSTPSPVTRWVGDIFNAASVVSAVLLFYFYFQIISRPGCLPWTDTCAPQPFDPQFWHDGYCVNVKNEKNLFFSTHAWCLYVDVALTVVLKLLMDKHNTQITKLGLKNEYLNWSILVSTLVHGVMHFYISYFDFTGANPEPDPTHAPKSALYESFFTYLAVYGSLYWASSPKFEWRDPKDPKTTFLITLVHGVAIVFAIFSALLMNTKPFFNMHAGFTAVQTLTITYAALIQLFYPKSEKGFAYASFAVIVTFMVNVVGWAIALGCTGPKIFGFSIQDLFGHVWFDTYLASSYIIFLFTALTFMKSPPPKIAAAVAPRKANITVHSKTK